MRVARTIDGVTYAPGAKFRVVGRGARLSGWTPAGPGAYDGWGQRLNPGDVIECTGHGPGFGSDPGHGVEWTSEQAKEAGAHSIDFWPNEGGMWNYHPAPGFLEPVVDDEMGATG